MTATVLQITDPHIGADWLDADPLDTLGAVLAAAAELPDRPQALLVTGDLANGATDEQYAALASLLGEVSWPVHVLPGNHDDRAALRRHFAVPGDGAEPVQYALDLGLLRVVMLDTVVPGEDGGALGAQRLAWLSDTLAERPTAPTLLAMHHPPFLTGLAALDPSILAPSDRPAFAAVLEDHAQVVGCVAGHVHRTIASAVAGRPAVTIPSTYAQARLDLRATGVELVAEPLAFALHGLIDGRLVSHVHTLPEGSRRSY